MKNADLHTHTWHSSDGELPPEKLVKKAKKVGINYLAVTDHDSIDGIKEALKAGKKYKINVIPGVELHSKFGEVLGLFIDYENKDLIKICKKNRRLSSKRSCRIINLLRKDKISISASEIRKRYNTNVIERPHIAYELVRKRYVNTFREAFDKLLGENCKYYIKANFIHTIKIVRIIKKAGGVAVIAHPYYEDYKRSFKIIKKLVREGLAGIEMSSGKYMPKEYSDFSKKARKIAKKHDLILTSGSDFHGKAHPYNTLGDFNCSEKIIDELKKRIS